MRKSRLIPSLERMEGTSQNLQTSVKQVFFFLFRSNMEGRMLQGEFAASSYLILHIESIGIIQTGQSSVECVNRDAQPNKE